LEIPGKADDDFYKTALGKKEQFLWRRRGFDSG